VKRIAVLLVLALIAVACGDDDTGGEAPVATEAPTGTEAPATTAPAGTAAPSSTAAAFDGPTDCRDIWPETAVTAVAGAGFGFTSANADASACVYGLSPGIALAWRTSDQAGFETSRSGAEITGTATDAAVCDAGWWVELQGAGIIMEAYSASQGRAYNATITGAPLDIETWVGWGTELLGSAC